MLRNTACCQCNEECLGDCARGTGLLSLCVQNRKSRTLALWTVTTQRVLDADAPLAMGEWAGEWWHRHLGWLHGSISEQEDREHERILHELQNSTPLTLLEQAGSDFEVASSA